jgi:hypothetical protein
MVAAMVSVGSNFAFHLEEDVCARESKLWLDQRHSNHSQRYSSPCFKVWNWWNLSNLDLPVEDMVDSLIKI